MNLNKIAFQLLLTILVVFTLSYTGFTQANWIQIGLDIDGEAPGDRSGSAVSLNADGTVVAIGATENSGGAPTSGHVRVYENIADNWVQLGGDINGFATGDDFGYAVGINDAGTVVVVGAPKNDAGGIDAGQVRVYELVAGTWIQIGAALNGEAAGDNYGYSVSINGDGTIVAIGAHLNDGIGADAGHVRVFENSGGVWTQIGVDIDGELVGDYSGSSVSINTAGDRVAIGAFKNDGGGPSSGHIRVYENSGGTWSQLGGDMNGENAGDECGRSVGISGDGTRVIAGAPKNDGIGADAGHARIYTLVGGVWTQTGLDIDGQATGDEYGWSVAISLDGETVALGGPKNDGSGAESGQVKAYQLIGGTWVQKGSVINGENLYDRWGWSTSINEDGTTLASGAYVNDGAGTSAGHTRIYRFLCDSLDVTISALELCFGEPLTLDATSTIGSTIFWDMGVVNGVAFIPASAGITTYTATTDSPNDCLFTIDILVNDLPIVTASVDPTEICLGESATFTGGGALSYLWDGGVTDAVPFTPVSTGPTTYTVTGTDLNGCENTATVDLLVNPLPLVTATATPSTICLGESTILAGSGADSYTWDDGIIDGVSFTPDLPGTYTYEVTGVDVLTGCSNTALIDLIVNDTPAVVASVIPAEICLGDIVTFTGSGADSYAWDLGVTDGVAYTPGTAGTFVHTVTGTITVTGCEGTDVISITVNDLPSVTATVDPTEICLGESAIFTGGGAATYLWDSGVTDGIAFTPIALGASTYTVSGTDLNGCENTASVDLLVHPLPVVTASASSTVICLGESTIFTGSGADTYSWDGGIVDGVSFTPLMPGIFTYTVTEINSLTGCESTATIDLTVNDTPTVIAIVTPTDICLGESVIFTGSGADSYVWDMGVIDGISYTPASSGTFLHTVIGTVAATGCQASAVISITVYDLPIVTATVDPIEICLGESAIFTGGGADTYVWDGGVTDGVTFTPLTAGTFTFTVIGSIDAGCSNSSSVDLIVNDLPLVIATASPTEVCLGESIVFTGAGADVYTWDGGLVDGIAFTPVIAETATYTVIGTDLATGCENSASVDVTSYPNPIVTATATPSEICLGESILFNGGGADSYTWDGGIIDGTPIIPAAIGTFTYTVVGYLGPIFCEATNSVTITVHELPIVTATVTPDEICLGESVIFKGEGALSYNWDGDMIDDEEYTPIEPGIFTYTVVGTNEWGCENSATVTLTVNDLPDLTAGTDTIINTAGTAVINAYSSQTGTYFWSPDYNIDCNTCPLTTANPVENTTYTIQFVDGNGCSAYADVLILVNFVKGIGVADAFTPNGDGTNDVLFVLGYNLEQIHFEIYNKYGEKVFATSDQRIGWDGTYHDMEQNPGVFTWVLYYTLTDGERGILKGNTTLIR